MIAMSPSTVNARVLLSDKVFLAAVALTLMLLGAIGWFAFGGESTGTQGTKKFTHMHCSKCNDEIFYSPKLVGTKCTNCTDGGVYQPTIGSIFDEDYGDGSNTGRIVAFAVAFVVAAQGLVFFGFRRLKALRERAEDARHRMVLARCPFCKRKVAYPVAKAGTWTTCYQCKTAFELPAVSASDSVY
jgi:hypothetical protein